MERSQGAIRLKKGREKPVANRHPWIFSGAISAVEGSPEAGDLVDVFSAGKTWLGTAYYNPHSQIRARILSWNEQDQFDESWWRQRLSHALAYRHSLELAPKTDTFRVVYAEADGLPGLVVDKYGSYLVLQALTYGIDRRKRMLASLLWELMQPEGIIERSDVDVREKEGLAVTRGLMMGNEPPQDLTVTEHGHHFGVDLVHGHKTGLYLDQRDNRALFAQQRFSAGREVLNVFAYTGGFALYAIGGGASSVTNIDTSADLLAAARSNVERNFGARPQDTYVQGDAFQILRDYRDTERQFDVVILDPPKFAHSRRDVQAAARGYKDLNWLAFRILRPGGILATFSCSGLVDADLFQKIVFSAASDAGRNGRILYHLSQAPDHPILLTFPESAYLKGLFIQAT